MGKYLIKVECYKNVETYIIEAAKYTKEDVTRVLTEVHPEWKILSLTSFEDQDEKEAV